MFEVIFKSSKPSWLPTSNIEILSKHLMVNIELAIQEGVTRHAMAGRCWVIAWCLEHQSNKYGI